jgi:hypothetical protein
LTYLKMNEVEEIEEESSELPQASNDQRRDSNRKRKNTTKAPIDENSREKEVRINNSLVQRQTQATPPSKESATSKRVKATSRKNKMVHKEISLKSEGSTSESSLGYSPLSVSQAGVHSSPNDNDD